MVLLAAAICTKSGKALVSRQFVEMTRARVEGLLASFPKLIGTGKQHTFIETESVRYVYQPMDKLYMLLITTKASNILEDLETLRLFSRVIPEYCKTIEEKEINEHCFELLFAFDEIVALGYRENVNLAQIRTFTDMESQEEKAFKAMRETQEKEAKQKMLERAEEIRRQKVSDAKSSKYGPSSSNYSGGFGNSSMSNSSSYNNSYSIEPSVFETTSSNPPPSFSNSNKPSRAMKLGKNKDIMPAFIEQQALPVANKNPTGASVSSTVSNTESVNIRIDEKINLTCGKDGGVQNLEVLGVLYANITSEEDSRIKIAVRNSDSRNLQLQTNPNIDKNLFKSNSVIGLRDPTKSFPLNTDVGVLKWRFQSQDESEIPLAINCWPSETKNGCEVSIEYELQKTQLELNNVVIAIPIPSNVSAPIVQNCDGDYSYEKYKNCMFWRISTIDKSNASGTLEFNVSGRTNDFFPVNVQFSSEIPYCNIQVGGVVQASNTSESVKHAFDVNFTTDKYEIV